MPYFGREGDDFGCRDVGEVGHDQVKWGVVLREEVGSGEMDTVGELVTRGIVRGESEGDWRKVGGVDFGVGQGEGNGQGDDAATSADVEDAGPRVFFGQLDGDFDKLLGFVAGDQGALIARESAPVEFGSAKDVLEWLAAAAAFDRVAKRDPLGLGQGTVELEVKLHALEAEGVREQVLGVEA